MLNLMKNLMDLQKHKHIFPMFTQIEAFSTVQGILMHCGSSVFKLYYTKNSIGSFNCSFTKNYYAKRKTHSVTEGFN